MTLNEVGITFAFPKRDIHFDVAGPLKVGFAFSPGELLSDSTGKQRGYRAVNS